MQSAIGFPDNSALGLTARAIPALSPSKVERAGVRAAVFTHLAGVVVAPTVSALSGRGVIRMLSEAAGPTEFAEIVSRTGANPGYLRVALRLLASCGWVKRQRGPEGGGAYTLTAEGRIAMTLALPIYIELASLCASNAPTFEACLFDRSTVSDASAATLRELVARAQLRWRLAPSRDAVSARVLDVVCRHLDGVLIAPAMVALARGGIFARMLDGPVSLAALPGDPESLASAFELLAIPEWVTQTRHGVQLTDRGRYAAQIAPSYAVTVSYQPMLAALPTLIFGDAAMPRTDADGAEVLVNRALNVWGSGRAHKTYFKKLDDFVIDIFNRPLDQQPLGICEMGTGDGTLLAHLYSLVRHQTARGPFLNTHPLVLVGADFNDVARCATSRTLRSAGVPLFHVIPGDINQPAQLATDLAALGLEMHDLLHVRSFLDHNRPHLPMADFKSGLRPVRTSGAFAHIGAEIAPDELEENLVRHLRRWAPHIGRFGLLVLELHTLPPALAAANLDRTATLAYDATHGFSDQYLVELSVFLECAREAGLRVDERFQAKFPASELATVSLNYFTTPR